ncbi:MAG: 30S ribosomal protein S20 [Bacillota bacterium]|uniref:Small ribosomal subunit protein bS20 n=1 Tax=Virgibacillus salarius TaxID=447199 RepID=A0A941DWZ8_9BACI|nr:MULTISPECIES: 30S ribosomal protein S20 [Bacillaceae]NAZ10988.1 30S ribosomal protein S20 [Agaribacter marinus]MBR7798280.1 30S ribosomal protein S20 [Virgibacillus salarius]MCC2252265.1 30S ribosomal protein S20 [Virgibacillus sp. AGTR]MDY7044586.1 30S ribosomal protein S20 [Virgibacillus sp. M23]QRZ17472.1 30S ribosomal protein S20 [Virgibacillus sp. AGTR]
MANIKSAIKRVETNNKKRTNNVMQKSEMRSQIKRVEKLVEANDKENAIVALKDANKSIDKAVQKGIIHANNGNRQKSRLAKKLNQLGA